MDSLNRKCNEAYLINDFRYMRTLLDQWQGLLFAEDTVSGIDADKFRHAYANMYKQMGSYYFCIADDSLYAYGKAVDCYTRSLSTLQRGRNIITLNQKTVLNTELAQIHYKFGHYGDALRYLSSNMDVYDSNFMVGEWMETSAYYALCLARLKRFPEAFEAVEGISPHNELLRTKGKIYSLAAEATDDNGPLWLKAYDCYREYFVIQQDTLKRNFNNLTPQQREQYWLRKYRFMADCYRLENEIEGVTPGFLYNVALLNKNILLQYSSGKQNSQKDSFETQWIDIQKKLKPGECAIEFVQYEKFNRNYLGALILKHKGTPVFIRIISVEQLNSFILADRITVEKAVHSDNSSYKNLLYSSEQLGKLIWPDQLMSHVADADKIYFSPDGIFHNLAIEYLFPESDSYELYRLTGTRELVQRDMVSELGNALIYGDINYNKKGSLHTGINDSLACRFLAEKQSYFSQLAYTGQEVDSISMIRENSLDVVKKKSDATEEYLRENISNFAVVHIATHGNYDGNLYPKGSDLKAAVKDETLSRSVLLLSGAQENIGKKVYDASHYDGILSAKEMALMDLSGVDLFVASACQSALGEITSGGVYGLQRGLKSAGAGAMVLSLWSVDDDATCYFMRNFYRHLGSGCNIHKAFWMAREDMDKKITYKVRKYNRALMKSVEQEVSEPKYSSPCYKNAFILIDVK